MVHVPTHLVAEGTKGEPVKVSRASRTGEGVVQFGAPSQWARRLRRFGRLATVGQEEGLHT